MHGLVAEILEQAEAPHLLAGQVAEDPCEHQIRQGLGGEWPLQLGIVVVHPLHEQLDGAAGVEAAVRGSERAGCSTLHASAWSSGQGPAMGAYSEVILGEE